MKRGRKPNGELTLQKALEHADAMAPRDRPDLHYVPSDDRLQQLSAKALRVLALNVRSLQRQLRSARRVVASGEPPPPAGDEA